MVHKILKPKRFSTRKFLNGRMHHSTACVYAKVDDYDVVFKISDCDKMIRLDFDAGTNSYTQRNALRKIDVLIDTLTRFRVALAAQFEYANEVKKQVKEEKKNVHKLPSISKNR